MTEDRLEILSVELLDKYGTFLYEFRETSKILNIALGWHYLLDLCWSAEMLQIKAGMTVLDAGAGIGIMQWWLAAHGVNVVSVDRVNRANLGKKFRSWCHVNSMRQTDLSPATWRNSLSMIIKRTSKKQKRRGTVTIYNQDLAHMPDIADNSVDAVVSISALEHNSHDGLRVCADELLRVLRPGGRLVATLAASRDKDWFHEPSKGWCYTEATLRDIFDLPADCPSNYKHYDKLFEELRNCALLRDNLAEDYFRSGDNGMPWGVWNPTYQPVGICKVKI